MRTTSALGLILLLSCSGLAQANQSGGLPALADRVEALIGSIPALEARIAALETENAAQQGEIGALQTENAAQQGVVAPIPERLTLPAPSRVSRPD